VKCDTRFDPGLSPDCGQPVSATEQEIAVQRWDERS
jgi:hypothetical protein